MFVVRLADPGKGDTMAAAKSRGFPSRHLPAATNESFFLLPIFKFLKFLRPTARQVVEYGGDCADLSGLLIVLLRSRHVKASKWALYSRDSRAQHAIVEVEVEVGKMVIDPLFGFHILAQIMDTMA